MLKLKNILVVLTVSFFVVTTTSLVGGAHGAVIFESKVNESVVSGVWFSCTGLNDGNLTELEAGNKTTVTCTKEECTQPTRVTFSCRFIQRIFREPLPEDTYLFDDGRQFPNRTQTSQRDQRFAFTLTRNKIDNRESPTIIVTEDDIRIEGSLSETLNWNGNISILPHNDNPPQKSDNKHKTPCTSRCEIRSIFRNATKCLTGKNKSRYTTCTIDTTYNMKDYALNRILTIRGVPCVTPCQKSNTSDIFSCQTDKNNTASYEHCSPNAGDDYRGRDCITVWDEDQQKCTKPCGYIGNELYKTCEVMAVRIGSIRKTLSSCSYDEDEVHLPNDHVTCQTARKAWEDNMRAERTRGFLIPHRNISTVQNNIN